MNVVHHATTETKENPVKVMALTGRHFTWILRVGIGVALGLGFLHLMFLNKLSTQGFALEELKSRRLAIQQEMEKWDIEIAIPLSLYALRSSEQIQEMENITKERTYVSIQAGKVAMVKVNDQ